jgi:membrane-associated phospholipid phosphatase
VAAFPSLHMSHVLILMWYVRSSRIGLTVMGLFSALTALSCVYFGWHYMVDLIAGVGVAVLAVAVTALFRTARKQNLPRLAAT